MHKIGLLTDFLINKPHSIRIADQAIVIVRTSEQEIYAVKDECPHARVPLNDGCLEGHELICLWHSWAFDIRDGQSTTHPGISIQSYPLQIIAGEVFIQI